MRVLYATTIVWGLLGTCVALLLIQVTSALDAWWKMSGIFGGGMLGLFLLGMISRKAKSPAAATGVILGVLIICWMTLSPGLSSLPDGLRSSFHAFMIPVFGTLLILLVGLILTKIAGLRSDSRNNRRS
jgi:SSS family solute:Na+ symporter